MPDVKKILLIRFSSLGDIVLTSPLIRTLRASYPNAQIDFLTKSEYADLVRFHPALSSVIELKTAERTELDALRHEIQDKKYDAILDLHGSLRSGYIRAAANARYMGVIDKRRIVRALLVRLHINLYREKIPVPLRYISTASGLGVKDDGKGLELYVPGSVSQSAQMKLAALGITDGESCIGLAPTATYFTKRWPAERFAETGLRLAREHGQRVLVFGGKSEREYCETIVKSINDNLGKTFAYNAAGCLAILETAAAFDSCSLIVSNDTGLMHVACARGRKIVALFGSSVEEFGFFPFRAKSIVLENSGLKCRPCSHIGLDECPKSHFRCMKEISVERVLTAASELH
jgi:heptosyltransferase-2